MQFIIKAVVIQNPSLLTVTLGKFREFHGHFFKRVYEFLSLVSGYHLKSVFALTCEHWNHFLFNAAKPNMSSNETAELAGSNVSATEVKNKRRFSALRSVESWKHRCKSPGTLRNFTRYTTVVLSVLMGRQRVKGAAGLWF